MVAFAYVFFPYGGLFSPCEGPFHHLGAFLLLFSPCGRPFLYLWGAFFCVYGGPFLCLWGAFFGFAPPPTKISAGAHVPLDSHHF